MGKATELRTTTKLVKEVLTDYPATRNSDDLLYIKVCECINPISVCMTFKDMLLKRKDWQLPAFETVRRTRQKVQSENPELAGNIAVEGHRKVNEEVFREYARSNV